MGRMDKGDELELIVSRRYMENSVTSSKPKLEYLIKWKGKSYLHVTWRTEASLTRINPKYTHRLKAFNRTAPHLPPPSPSSSQQLPKPHVAGGGGGGRKEEERWRTFCRHARLRPLLLRRR